jgi:hypothetical protein
MALVGPASGGPQPAYRCGTGTVRDVRTISETVAHEYVLTPGDPDDEVAAIRETNVKREQIVHVVTVQLDDREYTSRSAGDPFGTLDPAQLGIDESISMCVSAAQMILERPDGTDWRAPVIRIQRAVDRQRGMEKMHPPRPGSSQLSPFAAR